MREPDPTERGGSRRRFRVSGAFPVAVAVVVLAAVAGCGRAAGDGERVRGLNGRSATMPAVGASSDLATGPSTTADATAAGAGATERAGGEPTARSADESAAGASGGGPAVRDRTGAPGASTPSGSPIASSSVSTGSAPLATGVPRTGPLGPPPDDALFVDSVPARTAPVGPADRGPLEAFHAAWDGFYAAVPSLDHVVLGRATHVGMLVMELWHDILDEWRSKGVVRGEEDLSSPSWRRVEEIRRLRDGSVEIEYCHFMSFRLFDAAGRLIMGMERPVFREKASMLPDPERGGWVLASVWNVDERDDAYSWDCAWG